MPRKNFISQELVRQLLDYNPETGIFIWKYRPVEFFEDGKKWSKETNCKRWNAKNAGEIAGSLKPNGYIALSINNIRYPAHCIAFLYVYGYLPPEVDHIDAHGPKSDNRICNLRDASSSENHCNRGAQSNNKLGIKGVSQRKDNKKYAAYIKYKDKKKNLGYYDTPEEAAAAYEKAAIELHGEFARTK